MIFDLIVQNEKTVENFRFLLHKLDIVKKIYVDHTPKLIPKMILYVNKTQTSIKLSK